MNGELVPADAYAPKSLVFSPMLVAYSKSDIADPPVKPAINSTIKETPSPPATTLVIVGAPGSALGVAFAEAEPSEAPALETALMLTE